MTECNTRVDQKNFAIKDILNTHDLISDPHYTRFIEKVCHYYQLEPAVMYGRIKNFLQQKREPVLAEIGEPAERVTTENTQLTAEQQHAVDTITALFTQSRYQPVLLQGVTGSGKSEVYFTVMQQLIEQKKSVIFLVPEVSLALQAYTFFKAHVGTALPIYGFHSATSAPDKKSSGKH